MKSSSRVTRSDADVLVIGAGPAGLTAAYLLAKQGTRVLVLESDPQSVGGISRTVVYKGYRFDIGGHRFYSKSTEVEAFWKEILGSELLERPRASRIYYRGKFFRYPLDVIDALTKLGIFESLRCVLSYLFARLRPIANPISFRDWVVNAFGKRLFEIFFESYTEKVWGMPCDEISADWAAQRINTFSLAGGIRQAFRNLFGLGGDGKDKTLITSFRYPRLGPGQMWETCARRIREAGGAIEMGWRVDRVTFQESNACWTVRARREDGTVQEFTGRQLISSAPLRDLTVALGSGLDTRIAEQGRSLRYRDFVTVCLILPTQKPLSDNWIYIHDPAVHVGRVQNYLAWSPDMVPEAGMASLGLEYFCHEHDEFWKRSDADLIELAKRELETLGLGKAATVRDAFVIRQTKAYPVYDENYAVRVNAVRRELEEKYPTLHLVGRNGMHKYNNQDHSMMTAMLTVRNIQAGRRQYDVWRVNQDAQYIEAGPSSTEDLLSTGLREVPAPLKKAG